jgi:hypothetical protein
MNQSASMNRMKWNSSGTSARSVDFAFAETVVWGLGNTPSKNMTNAKNYSVVLKHHTKSPGEVFPGLYFFSILQSKWLLLGNELYKKYDVVMSSLQKKNRPMLRSSAVSFYITILVVCLLVFYLMYYSLNGVRQLRHISQNSYLETLQTISPTLRESKLEPEMEKVIFRITEIFLKNGESSEIKIAPYVISDSQILPVDSTSDDGFPYTNVVINNKEYRLEITVATGGMNCPKEPCYKTNEEVFLYPNDFAVWRDGTDAIYAITTSGVLIDGYEADVIIVKGVSSAREVEMWKQILKNGSIRKD